jgi:hypothetical protein
VAEVTLTIAQRHLLESWGLGLMVLSIGIGLLSLWLNKNAAQPRWRLARPAMLAMLLGIAMLLAMLLGIAMLLLTILAPTAKPVISQPSTATLSTPAARPASQAVAKPAEIAPAPAPATWHMHLHLHLHLHPSSKLCQTPVAASKPPPPVAKPAITASETKKPPSPVAVPLPQPRPAVVPKAVEPTEVRPETAKESP